MVDGEITRRIEVAKGWSELGSEQAIPQVAGSADASLDEPGRDASSSGGVTGGDRVDVESAVNPRQHDDTQFCPVGGWS